MQVIFIIGSAMAFFFDFLLLQKRKKSIADIILAIWMFIVGFHLLSIYGYFQEWHLEWSFLVTVFAPFPLLHGPFLYLYIQSLIREENKIRWWDAFHFLPYILGLWVFWDFINLSGPELTQSLDAVEKAEPLSFQLIGLATQFSGLLYAIISHFLLNRHQKHIKDKFSFQQEVSLNWIRYNIWAIGLIYVVVILSVSLEVYAGVLPNEFSNYLIYLTVTLFVFFFGYFGIRQENIFLDSPNKEQETRYSQTSDRYQRSGLKSDQLDSHYKKLLEYMDQEKPFLESKLTLNQLAKGLDISPNHLSQIINEKTRQNFYQFVNAYRIRMFKEKLQEPQSQHFTLLSIALDCGFNSKSSFNHTFKKFTGMTPSQYLKKETKL